MDDWMDGQLEDVAEAIRGLHAEQIAQGRVLRALISSHPNPEAMRKAWARFAAGPASDAAMSKVLQPERIAIYEANEQAIADWTRRVEEDLARR
ncbi:hypothetical protein [Stenotrophomonas maltophilia]|uniref:hypothetical protein n=1 Tax=Stenotrophomonas maltophilia TaxID=40324 RepID=UPI0013DC14EA|nr:hypothetical protein [Stenotrophomonas maltophilia]